MKRLLVFRGLAHDPQRVLAAVQRLTLMSAEHNHQLAVGNSVVSSAGAKLQIARSAYAEQPFVIPANDQKLSLGHENSLAPNACANETAPVPIFPLIPPIIGHRVAF